MAKNRYVLHSDERGCQEILAGPVDAVEAERIIKSAVDARMEEIGKSRDAELSISGYGTVISYADGGFPGKKLKERYQITTHSQEIWLPYSYSYRKLPLSMPAVIFLDGCKVTRNHKDYNMIPENSIPYHFSQCAYDTVADLKLDADIYAALDEISFFFPTPSQLLPALETDDHAEYILTLFVKEVERRIQEIYPQVKMKGQIFSISEADRDIYFEERKSFCRKGAAMYYAKEFLGKGEYDGKEKEELEDLLKTHGFYDKLVTNTQLYEGIFRRHRQATALDVMAGMLEEATKDPYKKRN